MQGLSVGNSKPGAKSENPTPVAPARGRHRWLKSVAAAKGLSHRPRNQASTAGTFPMGGTPKKKYKKAIAEDEILYESLKTNEGRTKYWEALWHDAKKSDLVSLFEECKSLSGNVIECGVWRGRTTKSLCRSLKETTGKKYFMHAIALKASAIHH